MRLIMSLSGIEFRRLCLALLSLLALLSTPPARAQGPSIVAPGQPMVFTYSDSQGSGRFSLQDAGADEATGGRLIKISLTQNNFSYYGSGFTLPLETTSPYTTLISFTLVSARTGISFQFQGKLISGITVSADGTYHRAGVPERRSRWNIVLAGGGGGGTTGPSAIRGVAMAGPIYPVEIPGVPNTRPLAGAVLTLQPVNGGAEIARVRADGEGRFQIPIAPGTYLLVPLPPDPAAFLPRGIPVVVTVRPGGFTDITVDYDTGIR
jgi:hypothetical protein